MMAGVVGDLKHASTMSCYTGAMSRDKLTEHIIEHTKPIVAWFEKDGKHYIAGHELSFVDFIYFELLELQDFITEGKIYTAYPTLKAYRDRIQNLPKVKEYYESDQCMKRPFNNTVDKLNNWVSFWVLS